MVYGFNGGVLGCWKPEVLSDQNKVFATHRGVRNKKGSHRGGDALGRQLHLRLQGWNRVPWVGLSVGIVPNKQDGGNVHMSYQLLNLMRMVTS